MLTSLSLTNFKKHANTVVDLTSGLNLITGPNYTGKSTILQGIRYALEGATAIPGGKAVATRNGADDHEIALEFVVNGADYMVTRSSKKATLSRDGKVIAKSASAVTAHLADLLGMPNGLFSKLRYGKQKETEALLTLGAGELQKIIGEVSQVEVVNEVITKCSGAAQECRGGLDALPEVDIDGLQQQQQSVNAQMGALHLELQELVEKIDSHNRELAKEDTKLTSLRARASDIQAENKERKRLADDYLALVPALDRAKAQTSYLDGADERYRAAQAESGKYLAMVSTWTEKANNLTHATRGMEHLLSQLSSSQKEVDKFAALLEGHSPETDTTLLDAQLKEIDTDLGVNRTKLFDVRASLGSGVCPTCKRPYEHDAGWLANLEAEEKVLMQEAADLQKERTRVARDVEAGHLNNESLRKVKERLAAAEHTRDSLLAERDASEKRIKLLSDEGPDNRLAEIRATAKKHQDEVNHLSTQATELATAMAQKADIEERLGMMSARIQVLGPAQDEPDTRPLEEAITTLKAELAELNQLYTPKSHDYTRLSGEHNTLSSMMITAHEQMEKRAKLESRLTVATALAKYLRGNRDRFMSTVWAGIMSQASSFTAACTGGDVTRVDRDEKGNFTYEEGGHVLPVQAASGAQRSIMGLGVQLALATMLPCPLATILLDEPGSDMDPERALALTSMLAADHNQLIMVSHRELDGAVANNTIALGG